MSNNNIMFEPNQKEDFRDNIVLPNVKIGKSLKMKNSTNRKNMNMTIDVNTHEGYHPRRSRGLNKSIDFMKSPLMNRHERSIKMMK